MRSARELDQRTECLPLPTPWVSSSDGRKSTGVTPWRGNTICVITSAVFMGDGIINKPAPPSPPAPAPVPPPLPLLSSLSPPHHHHRRRRAIHAYLNHPRPIKKKESPDASPDNYSIISSCHRGNYRPGAPCAGRTCRPDRRGLSWGREGKEWERGQRRECVCVCVCVRECVCVNGWGWGVGGLVYKMEIYDRDMVASFSLHTGNN